MPEYGWAYVVGTMVQGVSGSVQTAEAGRLSGSNTLVWTENSGSGTLNLTGSINVSGAINANELNINVVNKNVINLDASGSTKFGNSTDDTHIFTGSAFFSSSVSPVQIKGLAMGSPSSSYHYLALDSNYNMVLTSSDGGPGGQGLIDEYTNPGDNRVITSIDASGINAEANLLFDSTTLTVTGDLSASVGISSSVGQYGYLTASSFTDGVGLMQGGSISNLQTVTATSLYGTLTKPAQPNVTSVGTLTSLNVSGELSASALYVSSSNHRVGIGINRPQKKLEVLDPNSQLRLSYSTFIFASASNVYSDIGTNNSGELIINPTAQRVGIGTSSPTRMLDVNGHMRVSGNLEISGTLHAKVTEFVVSADNITFGNDSTDTLTFNAATASVPNGLNFSSNLLSLANSKVGIGVQYADTKLEVLDNTGAQLKLTHDQSNAATMEVDSIGNLTIDPSGLALTASSDLFVSGNTVLGRDCNDVITTVGQFTASCGMSASVYVGADIRTDTGVFTTSLQVGSSTVVITPTTISGATTITAVNYAGTLTTPAQPNVTSLGALDSLIVTGDLTVDTNTLKVDSATNRVGVNIADPRKPFEVLAAGEKQLRLTYEKVTGLSGSEIYTDFQTNESGYLLLDPSGGRVGIGTSSPSRMLDVNGHMRISGNLEITGALRAKVSEFIVDANNITFGDGPSDTLIFNSATGTIMNGLNWDTNTWVLDSNNNRIGVGIEHPTARLHVSSSSQTLLKLNATEFKVTSLGDLTITPAGSYITASSGLRVSGSSYLGTLSAHHTMISGDLSASAGEFTEITSSGITDGTVVIRSGDISNVGTLTATSVDATLIKAAQPNVTSLGTLTTLTCSGDVKVDTNTFYVDTTANRVGIGIIDPAKPLEISSSNGGVRLTYSRAIPFTVAHVYSDVSTNSDGKLVLESSGNKTKIVGGLEITGLATGTGVTTKYLALDSGNNIILTSSVAPGIETRNRRVITGNTTLSDDDYYIGIAASGDVLITLLGAEALADGQTFTIKDEGGTAEAHIFEIKASGSQLIDGEGSVFLESPYGSLSFYTNGSNKYFIF